MAVLNIEAVKGAVKHSASVDGGRNYTIELLAEVDSLTTGPIAIRDQLAAWGYTAGSHYRWPLAGAISEQDFGSYLQGIEVEPSGDDGLQYRVMLQYSPVDPTKEGFDPSQALNVNWVQYPWSAPPTLKWSSYTEEIACVTDRDGKTIINTAGDPFDPSPTKPVSTPVATVTRIEKSFNPLWISTFKDSVNEFEWLGWSAESVLCQDISGDRYFDPDWGWLWTVQYTFAFRPAILAPNEAFIIAGWDLDILNCGYRELVGGKLTPIILDGAPVSTPYPLDPDGKKVPPGDPLRSLIYKIYPTADFDALGLPLDLFTASTP